MWYVSLTPLFPVENILKISNYNLSDAILPYCHRAFSHQAQVDKAYYRPEI
jgi:hypothetical protein